MSAPKAPAEVQLEQLDEVRSVYGMVENGEVISHPIICTSFAFAVT